MALQVPHTKELTFKTASQIADTYYSTHLTDDQGSLSPGARKREVSTYHKGKASLAQSLFSLGAIV